MVSEVLLLDELLIDLLVLFLDGLLQSLPLFCHENSPSLTCKTQSDDNTEIKQKQ